MFRTTDIDDGRYQLYFKILMLTTIRGNVLNWMYKKSNTELQYLLFVLLRAPGRIEVSFSPLPIIHHTLFHQFMYAGMYTCILASKSLVVEPYLSPT